MQSLTTLLADFKPPEQTEQQKESFREWQANEDRVKIAARIDRACIPQMFRSASIDLCDERVKKYSEELSDGSRRGLVISGRVGRGKTYAASAVLIAHLLDYPVRFATMQGILREIQATFNGGERASDVVARYKNIRLLLIDDFGKEQPSKWSLPIMFEIIDGRYAANKPTIYTTQYAGKDLLGRLIVDGDRSTAEAIISRMSTCVPLSLDGENKRNIAAISDIDGRSL